MIYPVKNRRLLTVKSRKMARCVERGVVKVSVSVQMS